MNTARDWLLGRQAPSGAWCEQLEGDTTLESYWILLDAFLCRGLADKVNRLARSIRERALPAGGWPQYPGGPAELSVSCLSYFALKVAGDRADEPHMMRARTVITALGGAERANTYTRYHFALFGQCSWSDVPAIPPEMLLLPASSPICVYDMSSWSRTIFVPLAILYAKKAFCRLPAENGVSELFNASAKVGVWANATLGVRKALRSRASLRRVSRADLWRRFFVTVDGVLKVYERYANEARPRRAALERAQEWMLERFTRSDGLSAILPAMSNSVLALKTLGYADDDPLLRAELEHIDGLLCEEPTGALRMQPCLSPVWDTVLGCYALIQAGVSATHPALQRAATWLLAKQCRDIGDWSRRNPVAPGGWYFEHHNEYYPDVDDTCMALIVLSQARAQEPESAQHEAMSCGLRWMLGMQNDDGGWASFDRNNDKEWLSFVPFADHNAMIDPSTADITARVLECLSYFPGFGIENRIVRRALRWLRQNQSADGSWYGRWGVNYIYGTWQVLRGLAAIGQDMNQHWVQRAVDWLLSHQNADGGWGESIASYDDPAQKGRGLSTASQTAWALMGLMSAGSSEHQAVRRGVRFLLEAQTGEGTWQQEPWTGTGFPRVFYLNYHGYRHYFPLMALAQYREALFGHAEPQPAVVP